MINFVALMEHLSQDRPIFHSEADFQHTFAWKIHEMVAESQIRLEFKPLLDKSIYLDVWLGYLGAAVELKYPTRTLICGIDGEEFRLRNQGAQDTRRYDFFKDIQRLEYIVETWEPASSGFALFLTNDPSYWSAPLKPDTNDVEFRIHENRRISGVLNWLGKPARGSIKGRESAIKLRGKYALNWRDYSNPTALNNPFRYLLVEVLVA